MSFTVRTLKNTKPPKKRLTLPATIPGLSQVKKFFARISPPVKKNKTAFQRLLAIGIALVIAIAIGAIMIRLLIALQIVSIGAFFGSLSDSIATDASGHINVLLLGQGDAGHDGVDLTDTIMIASIDPKDTDSVMLVSLPRDLIVDSTYLGDKSIAAGRRINTLYRDTKNRFVYEGESKSIASAKAMRQVQTELSRITGIELQHTIKIDFIGFKKVVDQLGGVTIDVPYTIVDREYPNENYGYQVFSIQKGVQTLDGETALKYARSRHTTSDFSRSARQQQLIQALALKAKEEEILTKPSMIFKLLEIMNENFETTATTGELVQLASLGKKVGTDTLVTMQINSRNGLFNTLPQAGGILYTPPQEQFGGAAVLLPVSSPEFPLTWSKLQATFYALKNNRAVYVQNPTVSILNAGARSGAARLLASEFIRYGFNVTEVANATIESDLTTSIVHVRPIVQPDNTADTNATKTLEEFVAKLPLVATQLPNELPSEQTADITIIVGEDFTYETLATYLLPE